jgi:hypothetical protein
MRESTSTEPTRAADPCPTDEELAAYIDGGLSKAEKRRVEKHLAACADCFEIYSETARFLVDTSPASPEEVARERELAASGKVVRFPLAERVRPAAQWLSIAALLLIGVGGGMYFQFLKPPPALTTLTIPDQPASGFWTGPTYRGEGGGEEVKIDEAAFRMGVQLVNLQVSLRTGDGDAAEDGVARIFGLLKPQPFTDDLRNGYTGITAALVKHQPPASLLPEASRLAGAAGDAGSVREVFEPRSLDLGQWVEAGRLAALAHDPSFFRQGSVRSFLRHLLWRDKLNLEETKLDPPTRQSLERISAVLGQRDLQKADFDRLRELFDSILNLHYPKA